MGGHAIWVLAGIRYNQRDYAVVAEIINVGTGIIYKAKVCVCVLCVHFVVHVSPHMLLKENAIDHIKQTRVYVCEIV